MTKTITKKMKIGAPADKVFETLDNLGIAGMHMTEASGMMMGSKLHLEYLTEHRGAGSKYRWKGKMIGLKLDFIVEVTKWIKGIEKIWETIGEPRMIIYSWYRMHLLVKPIATGSEAELSITFERPESGLRRILSFLFADWYCNWCLTNMLRDARIVAERD